MKTGLSQGVPLLIAPLLVLAPKPCTATTPMHEWLDAISAFSAAVAAIAAAWQIRSSRRHANGRAAIELLEKVDERLVQVVPQNIKSIQENIFDYYEKGSALSDESTRYLALLNILDILAYSIDTGLTDEKIAFDHVRTLMDESVVSLTFIKRLQDCCSDMRVYEHLKGLFMKSKKALQDDKRKQKGSS